MLHFSTETLIEFNADSLGEKNNSKMFAYKFKVINLENNVNCAKIFETMTRIVLFCIIVYHAYVHCTNFTGI